MGLIPYYQYQEKDRFGCCSIKRLYLTMVIIIIMSIFSSGLRFPCEPEKRQRSDIRSLKTSELCHSKIFQSRGLHDLPLIYKANVSFRPDMNGCLSRYNPLNQRHSRAGTKCSRRYFHFSRQVDSHWGWHLNKINSVILVCPDGSWCHSANTPASWKARVQTPGAMENRHHWWSLMRAKLESDASRMQGWPDDLGFSNEKWSPNVNRPNWGDPFSDKHKKFCVEEANAGRLVKQAWDLLLQI